MLTFILCYDRGHNKQIGGNFSEDNRCWYIIFLLNIRVTCVSTYDLGHHQGPMITQMIKINGHDMDPYTCN
jgi:hypothetical protein